MLIKIFMSSAGNAAERDLLRRFGDGIESTCVSMPNEDQDDLPTYAHDIDYVYDENYQACDVAVIFGSWKPREKGHHVTRNSVANNAKTFVCIETALLNRRTDSVNSHWRVGINGFLYREASWAKLDRNTEKQRLEDLGIAWDSWKHNKKNGHIVLALQLPGDASLRGIDIHEWAFNTIVELRRHTERAIVVRSHPLHSIKAAPEHQQLVGRIVLSGIKDVSYSNGAVTPWSDDLQDAYCSVTYTSGLAIDSIIAGIPTIACDPGNFASQISNKFLSDVENLKPPAVATVRAWLARLTACQWSVDEMQDGTCWQHIETAIKEL